MRFGTYPVMAELKQRLTSLDATTASANLLRRVSEGMSHGLDLTLRRDNRSRRRSRRVRPASDHAGAGDLFNSMLGKALRAALEGYNAVRSEYQQALGDDSCRR